MPNKPSEKEEEYFARLEFERRKKQEAENQARIVEEEKHKLKELHYCNIADPVRQLVGYFNIDLNASYGVFPSNAECGRSKL